MGCTKDWGCIIAMTTADRGQIRPFWSRWCLYLSPVRDFVFAMVSYAFCKRFPETLTGEIFEHILYKVFKNRMIDLSTIFIDALISKPVKSRKSSGRNRSQKRRRCIPGSCAERTTARRRFPPRTRTVECLLFK